MCIWKSGSRTVVKRSNDRSGVSEETWGTAFPKRVDVTAPVRSWFSEESATPERANRSRAGKSWAREANQRREGWDWDSGKGRAPRRGTQPIGAEWGGAGCRQWEVSGKQRTLRVSLWAALALVPAPTLLAGRADAGSKGDGERGGTWSARHGLSGVRRRGECCPLRAATALRGVAPLLAVPRDRGHLRPLNLRRLLHCLLCPQSESWSPRRVLV